MDVGGTASTVDIVKSGTPSLVTNTQKVIDYQWSAGVISGNTITDNNNGTINIGAGEAMLRTSASEIAPLVSLQFSSVTNLALVDNSINYVVINYNAGTPIIEVTQSLSYFNCMNICLMATITREGTLLHIVDATNLSIDANRKHRRLILECQPFRPVLGGGVLGSTGLNIQLTAGAFWYGLSKISYPTFNTSVAGTGNSNIFTYYYKDSGGNWIRTANSKTIDNLYYNSASGLSLMGSNKYKTEWVYVINNNPTALTVIYGDNTFSNLATALQDTAPGSLPPSIAGIGSLMGRYIIKSGDPTVTQIENTISTGFQTTSVSNHNDLANIQGGTLAEYYHLTNTQYTGLTTGASTTLHTHDISNITGITSVSQGGTGLSTITGLVYGNGTSNMSSATASQIVTQIGTTAVNKSTNLVGGNTTTLLGSMSYQSDVDTTSVLSPNTTTTKNFLSQTGTGVNGAIPVWSTVSKTDVGLSAVENTALSTWTGTINISTLGTITTGTWNGSVLTGTYGGTGVNNGTKTITLGGNLTTSGAFNTTLTSTNTTSVTLPTSGTLIGTTDTGTVSNTMLANNTVTIGTTSTALGSTNTSVSGLVSIGLINNNITSGILTTTAVTQVSLVSFPIATYRSHKLLIQVTSGTSYHMTELNIIHDGTTVYLTEYGTLITGSALSTFDAVISGSDLNILVTPSSATSTVFKFSSNSINI